MLNFLFPHRRRKAERSAFVARLTAQITTFARQERFFRDFGVADDFEGRFELLILVATLVLRRLRALPAPADEVAQDLVDQLFHDFDDGLRRMGVSDIGVPRKMKGLGQGFYGRAEAYTEAWAKGDEAHLRAVLARNLWGGRIEAAAIPAACLMAFAGLAARLQAATLATILDDALWQERIGVGENR